jgi:hypothetical protein
VMYICKQIVLAVHVFAALSREKTRDGIRD